MSRAKSDECRRLSCSLVLHILLSLFAASPLDQREGRTAHMRPCSTTSPEDLAEDLSSDPACLAVRILFLGLLAEMVFVALRSPGEVIFSGIRCDETSYAEDSERHVGCIIGFSIGEGTSS